MKTKQTIEQEQSWNEFLKSPQFKNLLFYMMIAIVISMSVYVYLKIEDESIECMSSPLTYGAAHLTSSNNASIQCSCYSQGSDQVIYFDKDDITISTKGYFP